MTTKSRHIVLVHGLWDTPIIFKHLVEKLTKKGFKVFTPHLPHKLGLVSIRTLAEELNVYILRELGEDISINLMGFSMGGLISRFWMQKLSGARRTNRFVSVGTPHCGTLTAQLVPLFMFKGIAEMKVGSDFLNDLNKDIASLGKVECISFFCYFDLMVFPGWKAVLPIGRCSPLPVLTHKGLIYNKEAIENLINSLI